MSVFDIFKKKLPEKFPSYLLNSTFGTPKWSTQKDYEYVKEGYNKIVWVYACVSLLASCGSKVDWELWRVGKGSNTKDKQIFEHPIVNLINKQVNPTLTSKDFFEMWITYLALQGKFFATLNNSVLPTQIYPLYPHLTQPIPDRQNFVSGFEYRISNETRIYKTKEVIWSKLFDPLDFYEGLSPIKAMARTIDTENEAVDWNKSQLQNQAVPPGAIQVQNPSPEMQNKLRTEWLKRYGGAKNARVPLVLNAEKANYIPFGLSAVDMDFLNQRKVNMVEICAGFGIDPIMVGASDSKTFANYEQAERALWNETIIPKYLEKIRQELNLYVASKYGDNLEIRYNTEAVEALQDNQEELSKRAERLFKAGLLSKNEARGLVNYDEVEGGEEYFANPTAEIEKEPKDNEKAQKKKSINLDSEEKKEMYWKQVENDREKYDKATEKQFQKAFDEERKAVVKAIENKKDYNKVIDNMANNKQNILKAMYTLAITDFGEQSYKKIAKNQKADKKFRLSEFIKKWIAKITGERIVLINDTTKDSIKQRIKLGLDEGLSIQKIAKTIDDLYLEQIIPNRSTVIARTEVVSASNFGSLQGAEQAQEDFDIEIKKIWIRTFDERVRDTHALAGDHKPIPLDEKFSVGDSKLDMPGDPDGLAKEVINCRCAIGYAD